MIKQGKRGGYDAGYISDIVLAIVATMAVIVLTLDSMGLLELPWLQSNLIKLTFIAICALIVASALERRFILHSSIHQTEEGFKNISKQLQDLENSIAGIVSADLLLKDRTAYRPMEVRVQDAKEMCVSGKTLVAFITLYDSLFSKNAKQGCRFKFVIGSPTLNEQSRTDIEHTLMRLTKLQSENPTQIDIRISSATLVNSIIMIDGNTDHGLIQIEFYTYPESISDRPHIDLSPRRDPRWYKFYKGQFEALWQDARPYSASKGDISITNA